jgi:hypothetical protein
MGIPYKEALVVLAVAELTSGEVKECTSQEVKHLMCVSCTSETMRKMRWALVERQYRNDRGNMTYYYSLSNSGLNALAKLLEYEEVDVETFRTKPNKDKKKTACR